jgi:hypothetical protein
MPANVTHAQVAFTGQSRGSLSHSAWLQTYFHISQKIHASINNVLGCWSRVWLKVAASGKHKILHSQLQRSVVAKGHPATW